MGKFNYKKYEKMLGKCSLKNSEERPGESDTTKGYYRSPGCERGAGWLHSILIAISILLLVFAFQVLIERLEQMGVLH